MMLFLKRLLYGLLGGVGALIVAVVVTLISIRNGMAVEEYTPLGLIAFWLVALIVGFVRGWMAAGRREEQQ